MAVTVDTNDLTYGAGVVANSRPAVFSNISGSGLWYVLYAKADGTYYATSPDAAGSFTTHAAISGMSGRINGPSIYQGVRDIPGNIMFAYPGNSADGSQYMLYWDGAAWTPRAIVAGGFDGMIAHLYEGASTFFRIAHLLSNAYSARTTNPSASSTSWPQDYQFDGSCPGGGSGGFYAVGSNLVFVYAQTSGTPSIRYAEIDLDTVPGSPGFPTGVDGIVDASLDTNFAACLDGSGVIHGIYRIAGTGWAEFTYNGMSFTTGGSLPQLTDNDRHPAIMCDGAGTLHLVYARYNASNDYGIGYISKTSAGSWTAQSDVVTHNATLRTSVCISETTSSNAALITWREGGSTIKAHPLTVTPVGVNPVVATISVEDRTDPDVVSLSVEGSGGTPPYTYQWHRALESGFEPDGTNDLSGETADTLDDTPPTGDLYYYKCVVTDDAAESAVSNQLLGLLYEDTLILGFIGDSITSQTSGGDISTCEAMGERLAIWAGMRQVVVVDRSLGGTSTGQWQPGDDNYDDASAAFTSAGVTHVMVMLGTNGLSTTPPFDQGNMDTYISDMGNIVSQLVADGFKVIINAPPFISLTAYEIGDAYLQAMNEQLPALADGDDVIMGDRRAYVWFSQHADELIDGVHPTVLGIQQLGSLWALAFRAAFLVALLALAPTSDVSNAGSWTTNTGSGSNLYAAVDEGMPPNQADYIQSPTNPSGSTVVLGLAVSGTPDVRSDHSVRIQLKRG